VELEETVNVVPPTLGVTVVPDALQLVAENRAVAVLDGEGVLEGVLAHEHSTSEHRRLEPGALLVRPVHDLDRATRLDLLVLEGPQRLQGGENAELSVVPAP